jgi:hypothetical protein
MDNQSYALAVAYDDRTLSLYGPFDTRDAVQDYMVKWDVANRDVQCWVVAITPTNGKWTVDMNAPLPTD